MDILYKTLTYLAILVTGYLFGSISWAYIITRYFYHIDIYKVGSGNAGGTNVGRAVGKFGAILVIVLDIVKCIIPLWTWFFLIEYTGLNAFLSGDRLPLGFYYYVAGLGAALGHIFPLYTHFKGGKAVSCYAGFMIGTNWLLTLVGCVTFFSTLKWKKRVSLSSLSGVIAVCLTSVICAVLNYFLPGSVNFIMWFFPGPKMDVDFVFMSYVIIYTALVIILHKANIHRLTRRTEPETHFKRKGEEAVQNYSSPKEGASK